MAATSVAVPVRAFERIRRTAGDSAIIDLQFPDGASMTTVVHEYQMNPIRDTYTHVDFLSIALDEKLTSKVAIRPVGTPIGLKDGGVLEHSLYELEVEALPLDIPDYIEVDVSGLGLKHSIHVGALNLGEKVKVLTSDTVTVFSVVAPEVEEAPAPAEEAAAPAEGAAPAGAETAAPAASEETAKAAPKK
jgi:large subunit ribosomal protein L25